MLKTTRTKNTEPGHRDKLETFITETQRSYLKLIRRTENILDFFPRAVALIIYTSAQFSLRPITVHPSVFCPVYSAQVDTGSTGR